MWHRLTPSSSVHMNLRQAWGASADSTISPRCVRSESLAQRFQKRVCSILFCACKWGAPSATTARIGFKTLCWSSLSAVERATYPQIGRTAAKCPRRARFELLVAMLRAVGQLPSSSPTGCSGLKDPTTRAATSSATNGRALWPRSLRAARSAGGREPAVDPGRRRPRVDVFAA